MISLARCFAVSLAALLVCASAASAADASSALDQSGKPDLKSAGPLCFSPDGVLFVGDPQGGAIFAIEVKSDPNQSSRAPVNVANIDQKIASLLGTSTDQVMINDMAVDPTSGAVYMSVARGQGANASPVMVRVDSSGKVAEVPLSQVKYAKAELSGLPEAGVVDRRGASQRQESITDLAYVDGRLIVAGLSNEEFASKLRSIPFPFAKTDAGTSVEIYHGAHGAFETRSPVRTFVPFNVEGEACVLAAYTCTPLVKFPLAELVPGAKIMGKTVAELGNRNRPLDMVVYTKDGSQYLLLANSSRGVMKITTEEIGSIEPITARINGTAGAKYDTIDELTGVEQLDKLDDASAVLLVRAENGSASLKTVPLP